MTPQVTESISTNIRLSIKEFNIPPVRDCLVVGRESPIGCVALKQALTLLHGEIFEDLHPESDIVSDVLVRAAVLRRISRVKFLDLIVKRVGALMSNHEIVLVNIDLEVFVECQI